MMPYIQGEPDSVPEIYRQGYEDILSAVFIKKFDKGYLTIDESVAKKGKPHRGDRAKFDRPLHTEAGYRKGLICWGGGSRNTWGSGLNTILDSNVEVLLANNIDDSCAIWESDCNETSEDGDIGHLAHQYKYSDAILVKSGEVHKIGIFTPHESLPVKETINRQFIRIIGSGVYGKEPHFTENPLMQSLHATISI